MGGIIPTESNISMVGVGLLGRTTSGAGKSSRLPAASVRSFCSVYSTSEVDTLLAAKANSSHTHSWSDITSGLPTTISGYGITNAYTKTEVDNLVAGLLDFKGNQDCSANPNYPSASKGDAYYVSVAGKIGGASGVTVAVGDLIVCSADNAGGTQASVGSSWFVLEKNLDGALASSNNLSDLASASTARINLGLGTLATQSGTFSGTSSGTNTGDQSTFGTIAVSGQSNVVADQNNDTLTLVAGTNITITTDASTDAITIAAVGSSGNSFETVQPAIGGTNGTAVVADSSTDTLTIDTGCGATISGNSSSDTITINAFGVIQPPYYSQDATTYYNFGVASSGNVQQTANTLVKRPILIYKRVTITKVTMTITTLAASGKVRIGLRNMNQSTGEATTLVSDFGEVDASSTGVKTISSLSVTVDPGWYYLEFACNSTTIAGSGSTTANAPKIAGVTDVSGMSQYGGLTRSFTYGSLPSDETGVSQTLHAGNMFTAGLRF